MRRVRARLPRISRSRRSARRSSCPASISPTNQQSSAEYLRINPKARVPALADGDWVLTEAPAILRYIAARHPAAGLWPWDSREEARCAEWLNWLSSTIQIAFTHVRRAARYVSDRPRG